MGICHVDDHVQLPVSVYVLETQCHDCQVLFSDKSRHKIDFGFPCVSPWKLDNLYMVVYVDGDKVARMICRVAVTDYHICLECAGSTIVDIVLGEVPPTDDHHSNCPQRNHPQHPETKIQQRVCVSLWSWLLCCLSWLLVGYWWWCLTQGIFPVPTVENWRVACCGDGITLVAACAIWDRGSPPIVIIVVVPRVRAIWRRTRTRNNRVFCIRLPLVHLSLSFFLSSMRSAASRSVIMPSTMLPSSLFI